MRYKLTRNNIITQIIKMTTEAKRLSVVVPKRINTTMLTVYLAMKKIRNMSK